MCAAAGLLSRRAGGPAAERAAGGGSLHGAGGLSVGSSWIISLSAPMPYSSWGSRAGGIGVRRVGHFDVGIHAVVLHGPAHAAAEPGGVPRLGHAGAVGQGEPVIDAHHAAPGPRADDRADPPQLGHLGDDVAVGAGKFIGEDDHRTPRGVVRVGPRAFAARHAPAGDLPANQLGHQLGRVAAAVPPDVHDQPVQGSFGVQVAVQLRPAVGHHVRDVQVPVAAAGGLPDGPAVRGHPLLVAQALLVLDRDHGDAPLLALPRLRGRRRCGGSVPRRVRRRPPAAWPASRWRTAARRQWPGARPRPWRRRRAGSAARWPADPRTRRQGCG